MRTEPATFPPCWMRLPLAWTGKITWAMTVMKSGYTTPVRRVISKNTIIAGRACFRIMVPSCESAIGVPVIV